MEQQDFIYVTYEQHLEFRKMFKFLWDNEPIKLNTFLHSGQYPLKEFDLLLCGKKFNLIKLHFFYGKNKNYVSIADHSYGYYLACKDMYIVIGGYHSRDKQYDIYTSCNAEYRDERAKKLLTAALKDQGRTVVEYIQDLTCLFFMLNLTIVNLPHKVKETTEKDTKTIEVKKGGSKTYKSVVYLKHTYSFDKCFKVNKGDLRHVIKCPAWGVRGHQRHMKSGKIVWVKPYVKGKERHDPTKYVGKEYRL